VGVIAWTNLNLQMYPGGEGTVGWGYYLNNGSKFINGAAHTAYGAPYKVG